MHPNKWECKLQKRKTVFSVVEVIVENVHFPYLGGRRNGRDLSGEGIETRARREWEIVPDQPIRLGQLKWKGEEDKKCKISANKQHQDPELRR
jgi:hypothetical protein